VTRAYNLIYAEIPLLNASQAQRLENTGAVSRVSPKEGRTWAILVPMDCRFGPD
jgi:hypothetical protein